MMKRLETLLEWVNGPVIADIGCDHALLDIMAVKSGQAVRAYACDIAAGPLNRAVKAIQKAGMTDKVIPVLCDGIPQKEDVDQIIIAGMGADTIIHILQTSPIPVQNALLSPHSRERALRQYLMEHDCKILRERRISERGHYYPVLEVEAGQQALSEAELEYGIHIMADEDFYSFITYERARLQALLQQVPAKQQEKIIHQQKLLEDLLSARR